jgi:predicted nucleotide-binding protein
LLHSGADVHPWWESESFKPNSSTLDSLFKAANKYDFGVFIFSPEDIVKSRKETFFSARDNVLFEFGLFLGAMGADRTFGLVADSLDKPIKTPTDLLGIYRPIYIPECRQFEIFNRCCVLQI